MEFGDTAIPMKDGIGSGGWPPGLRPGTPQEAGLDAGQLEQAFAVLSTDVASGRLPGAVAVIARRGIVAGFRAIGWAQLAPERREMEIDTIFDCASLTKVMVSLPLALRLLERGALRVDESVQNLFPAFTGKDKEQVRVRHLLTHTGGFFPGIPLPAGPITRAEHIHRTLTAPLESPPGTRVIYSDLGFVLLGELVGQIIGQPLDRAAGREIFGPLGFPDAGYNPSPGLSWRCAATEYRSHLGRYQCGEVHDERAAALGGVAGHAGLFATALEVAAYGQLWCNGGVLDGVRILSRATVAAATRSYTAGLGESRGWGWIVAQEGSESLSCGELFSPGSFGHTGFTGTSLWVDPSRELVVALMTNRVHLGRQTEIIQRLRPRFHNAVAGAVQ